MSLRRAPGARARARDRAPTPATRSSSSAAAGCKLWDAEGNEYLDFLAGISVLNVGHCHPRVVQAVRDQAGRLMHAQQPVLHRPGDAAVGAAGPELAGRQGVPVQLGRRGQRGRDQAVSREPGPAARSWSSSRPSTGAPTGRCRPPRRSPSRRRSRRWSRVSPSCRRTPGRSTPPSTPDTAAVLLEPIQGETGINVLVRRAPADGAREPATGPGAALVFDEIQCGMGRTGTPVGLSADRRRARRDDLGQGAGRRAADRRADHRRAARRRVRARRPRLDVRRRPGRRLGGARRARHLLGPASCWSASSSSASACAPGLESLPYVAAVRGRGLMVAIDVADGVDAPRTGPARAARAAAGRQRHRAGHDPAGAAADRVRAARSTRPCDRLGALSP